jgi:hypothetical protein
MVTTNKTNKHTTTLTPPRSTKKPKMQQTFIVFVCHFALVVVV